MEKCIQTYVTPPPSLRKYSKREDGKKIKSQQKGLNVMLLFISKLKHSLLERREKLICFRNLIQLRSLRKLIKVTRFPLLVPKVKSAASNCWGVKRLSNWPHYLKIVQGTLRVQYPLVLTHARVGFLVMQLPFSYPCSCK